MYKIYCNKLLKLRLFLTIKMGQKRYYKNKGLKIPTHFNISLKTLTNNNYSGFVYIPGREVTIGGKRERANLGLAVICFLGKLPNKGLTEQEIRESYPDYSKPIIDEWIKKDLTIVNYGRP